MSYERSLPMAMLPNDSHPGPGCSCADCLRTWPEHAEPVRMKPHKFSYDEKCEELALYFTLDESSRHIPVDELAQAIQDAVEDFIENYDPTPWCGICGARFRDQCECPAPAENE